MRKIRKTFSLFLFFLPPVINTLVVLWLFVYPWRSQPQQIHIPIEMLLILLLFWISGVLLCFGKWYGGIPAAAIPVTAYLQELSGYTGMSHIDWFPIAAGTVLFYILCGFLSCCIKNEQVSDRG